MDEVFLFITMGVLYKIVLRIATTHKNFPLQWDSNTRAFRKKSVDKEGNKRNLRSSTNVAVPQTARHLEWKNLFRRGHEHASPHLLHLIPAAQPTLINTCELWHSFLAHTHSHDGIIPISNLVYIRCLQSPSCSEFNEQQKVGKT